MKKVVIIIIVIILSLSLVIGAIVFVIKDQSAAPSNAANSTSAWFFKLKS